MVENFLPLFYAVTRDLLLGLTVRPSSCVCQCQTDSPGSCAPLERIIVEQLRSPAPARRDVCGGPSWWLLVLVALAAGATGWLLGAGWCVACFACRRRALALQDGPKGTGSEVRHSAPRGARGPLTPSVLLDERSRHS